MNNVLSSRLAALRRRADENLIAFLRTEVDVGLTLVGVAKATRNRGHENWERSAEDAYLEVALFLVNPQYAERMPDEHRRKIEVGMDRLRNALDALPKSQNHMVSDGEALASNRQPSD